jgi:hypothetical protein
MTALNKKQKATKCCDHRTMRLIAHPERQERGYFDEELKRNLRMYSEKISLDLEEGEKLGIQLQFSE